MALNAFKRLKEDLELNTSQVVGTVAKTVSTATRATSAGYAGTSRVAHYGSSGTAALAGTSSFWSTSG
jgi:hypothetical protein